MIMIIGFSGLNVYQNGLYHTTNYARYIELRCIVLNVVEDLQNILNPKIQKKQNVHIVTRNVLKANVKALVNSC